MKIRYFFILVLMTCGIACTTQPADSNGETYDESSEHTVLQKEIKSLEDSLKAKDKIDMMSALELIAKSEAFATAYPNDAQAPFLLFRAADVARGIGEYKLAIQHWQTVFKNYPEYKRAPETQFMIGFTYENNLKNIEQARKFYNGFIQQFPNHELVPQVKLTLENIEKSPEDLVKEFRKNLENQ